jgi:hypothetical protein
MRSMVRSASVRGPGTGVGVGGCGAVGVLVVAMGDPFVVLVLVAWR